MESVVYTSYSHRSAHFTFQRREGPQRLSEIKQEQIYVAHIERSCVCIAMWTLSANWKRKL